MIAYSFASSRVRSKLLACGRGPRKNGKKDALCTRDIGRTSPSASVHRARVRPLPEKRARARDDQREAGFERPSERSSCGRRTGEDGRAFGRTSGLARDAHAAWSRGSDGRGGEGCRCPQSRRWSCADSDALPDAEGHAEPTPRLSDRLSVHAPDDDPQHPLAADKVNQIHGSSIDFLTIAAQTAKVRS